MSKIIEKIRKFFKKKTPVPSAGGEESKPQKEEPELKEKPEEQKQSSHP